MGVTAPQRVAATLYDDFLPQLSGRQALKTWREMATNDATVSSILFAINMLAREVDWTVQPADESVEAETMAGFLTEQVDNLAHPLSDTVGESFTSLPYGFSFHETVYQNIDGRIGWERFSHRPQETLLRWILDPHLRPVAFVQTQHGGAPVAIPVEKGFLYRMDTTVPSGTPILRGAYRSWMLKKRAEEQLMIGMARNLSGLPQIKMPTEVLLAGDDSEIYTAMKQIVTRVKRDEQMGLLMPSDRVDGELQYEFDLVSPDANPNFDQIIAVVRMFAGDIAATVLAQFVGLGRDTMGSRALAEPQQQMFQTALGAMLDVLEEQFNRQTVKALFDLNPQLTGPRPRLVHGEVKDIDIKGFGEALLKIAQAGGAVFNGEPDDPRLVRSLELLGFDTDQTVQ